MKKAEQPQRPQKVLDPRTVPSVQRFLTARDQLDAFKAAHPTLLEELRELMSEYNAAAEAADKELRAQRASCGPFELLNVQVSFDAERLFTELGEEEFRNIGGKVSQVDVYEVDKTTVSALIQMGKIPPEIVAVVRKETPSYRKIQPCFLP